MSEAAGDAVGASPPSGAAHRSPARIARRLLGVLLGAVAKLWLRTLRVTVSAHPALECAGARPWILAFLHGKQWPLLAWRRRRPTLVMVSLSGDGEMQASALSVLGLSVVRGSSSRGGARALAAIVRGLRHGARDAAFAVDGPRGPYGIVKPGAVLAARRAGALIVPMGSAVASGRVMRRAWDRFALAWPFSRVAVVLGAPIAPGGHASSDTGALGAAIAAANEAAESILAAPGRVMYPLS